MPQDTTRMADAPLGQRGYLPKYDNVPVRSLENVRKENERSGLAEVTLFTSPAINCKR